MRPTLHWLVQRRELHLHPLVPGRADPEIRWVHVSELDDPTPHLSGGELLLTTGKGFPARGGHWDDYVRRLTAREAAGLGFGVGHAHAEVPRDLVDAAAHHDLPLLAVPRATPFIAISETVAAEITRGQERLLTHALETQADLVHAALSTTGSRAVVGRLAQALDAWVLLLDADGQVRHAAPARARGHAARIRMDLDALGLRTRLQAASLTVAGDQVAVLPIDVRGHLGGYLAIGRTSALAPVQRSVLTSAVRLLALDLAGELDEQEAQRRERRAVLRLAVDGHPDLAELVADTLGVAMPPAPLRVAFVGCPREALPRLLRVAEDQHGLRQAGALTAQYDSHSAAVLLPVAEGDLQALDEVLHRVPQARAVVTEGVRADEVSDALRRARSVYFGSSGHTARLVLAEDVTTAGLLAQLDNPSARGWAAALLEPLDRHAQRSKLDLISTLRVFLRHNGHVDSSSTELGIHRHTLRYRLGRITDLLDCTLDDPTTRAELRLRDQDGDR